MRQLSILLMLLLCIFSYENPSYAAQKINLVVGKEKPLRLPNIRQYSVADKKIIGVKVPQDQKSIIITGRRRGLTTLTIVDKNGRRRVYEVNVLDYDPESVYKELKPLFKGIEGIKLKVVGTKVILDGEVHRDQDLKRIKKVMNLFQGKLFNLVDASYVSKEFMVELEVSFVEISKNDGHRLGIDWNEIPITANAQLSTSDLSSGNFTKPATISTDVEAKINFLVTEGLAKIYDKNSVVVENGKEAFYQSGGELNIPISGTGSVALKKVSYGTILKAKPRVDKTGGVHLLIDAEVSSLDESNAKVLGIPGIRRNRVKTSVNLKTNQSLVLWGIINTKDSMSEKGWPGLRLIPLLGYFFKGESVEKGKTVGLIFITPRVISATSRRNKAKLKILKEHPNPLMDPKRPFKVE